jgi:hypothetical protein
MTSRRSGPEPPPAMPGAVAHPHEETAALGGVLDDHRDVGEDDSPVD